MKAFKYILVAMAISMVACKKDFLERLPQTSVTEENFFRTPTDLETYTNGFYAMYSPRYNDVFSDNIAGYTGTSAVDNMVRGNLTPANMSEGWDTWDDVRRINFMMDHLEQTTGDAAAISHFVGIAKFFRAYTYYEMVKHYGDVPWYSHAIGAEDEESLMKPNDPRTLVVDSIMADLEFAVANVKPDGTNTRITKWTALTLLARIALHEGTFRKYHEELNLQSTANTFLERAATASQQIMEEGGFSIYNTGNPAEDFRNLFSSASLAANREIILLLKNDRTDGVANNTHTVLDWQWALSGSLANEFLMKDGKRFTDEPDYDKKTFTEVFANRDPRLAETIMTPGFKTDPASNQPYLIKPSFGGYLQIKFYPRDPALRGGWNLNYTDLPIMRYAEVLLIHAEAKAELGTINQGDLDKTIGLLRARAAMPALSISAANTDADPFLALKYANVSGANKGLILEIRRERRAELACEGFRYDDLMRWKTGAVLGENAKGIYVPALGALDVTGDGKADIAILQNPNSLDPIASLPAAERDKLVKYYLSENTFYLSNNTSGNIMFVKDKQQPRSFVDPKYYYWPIPLQQIVLNPNLKQPAGWQ